MWKNNKVMKSYIDDLKKFKEEKFGEDQIKDVVINVFDFDGTIFNSPNPSKKLWDKKTYGKLMSSPKQGGHGWYQNTLTLNDKYIVNSIFNDDVLSDIRKSMDDDTCITVLLTGRTTAYSDIIQAIVMREGLEFDEYGFKPLGERETTFGFKIDFIKTLIDKYGANVVNIWDDRIKHVIRFREWLEMTNTSGEVHHIDCPDATIGDDELEKELVDRVIKKENLYESTGRHPIYQAAFLYPESHSELLSKIEVPDGWKTFAHHMTLLFGRNKNAEVEEYISKNTGADVKLVATEVGRSDNAIAVKIKSDVPTDNKVPHVTIAVPQGGSPVKSNNITSWEFLEEPIELSAKIGAFYGK